MGLPEAKTGVILDEHGRVVYDDTPGSVSSRTSISWNAKGWIPKLILVSGITSLLLVGFGVAAVVLATMLVLFFLRMVARALFGSSGPR